jgi:hypothetical protein
MIFSIHQIFYNGDSGEDDNTLLGYMTSEEKAIDKVAKLNQLHIEAVKIENKVEQYTNDVIYPSIPLCQAEDIPNYPRWKEGIHQNEITEEMRNERNRIIQIQKEIRERNYKLYQIRNEQIEKMKQDYIDSLNICSDVLKTWQTENENVLRYEYRKIEELK